MGMLHGQLEEIESLRNTLRQKDAELKGSLGQKSEVRDPAGGRVLWMREWLWGVLVAKVGRVEGEEEMDYYLRRIEETSNKALYQTMKANCRTSSKISTSSSTARSPSTRRGKGSPWESELRRTPAAGPRGRVGVRSGSTNTTTPLLPLVGRG